MSIVSSEPESDVTAVPPTEVLIREARQHRRKRSLCTVVAVALVAVLATGIWFGVNRASSDQPARAQPPLLSGGSPGLMRGFEGKSPRLFLALRGWVTQPQVPPRTIWVAASSTKNGSLVRKLLPFTWDGMSVQGLSIDHRGGLWVTYAKSADCSNHPIPNSHGPYVCGPIANTCRSIVARYDLRTGASTVEYRGTPSEELGGAAASPDGRLLAFLTRGCTAASGVLPAVRVRDVATGRTWTAQRSSTRCGAFSLPSFDFAGRALLFNTDVGKIVSPPNSSSSGCETTSVWLSKVSAHGGGPSAVMVHARRGCEYQSVAPLVDGTAYAIEACGGLGSGYIHGPAYLVHLDATLRPLGRHRLGHCTNGNGMSTSGTGSVLISAYLFCGGRGPTPTKIWRVIDGRVEVPVTTDGTSWWGEQLAW